LIAEVDAPPPFGPLLVVNHFPDYQLERERQTVIAARTLEKMHAQHPTHILLAGDLDAEPDAARACPQTASRFPRYGVGCVPIP
jgi:endonuclease/exonuclease/phosphatase family metal-dependent hydrolase